MLITSDQKSSGTLNRILNVSVPDPFSKKSGLAMCPRDSYADDSDIGMSMCTIMY